MRCAVGVAVVLASMAGADVSYADSGVRRLEGPTEIQGFLCDKPLAAFFASGRLSACKTAGEVSVGQAHIPIGSYIHLNESGSVEFVQLSQDTVIAGYRCKGDRLSFRAETTQFYPDGALKGCYLVDDMIIQAVPCERGRLIDTADGRSESGTYFDPSGKLERCVLSHDFDGRKSGTVFTAKP